MKLVEQKTISKAGVEPDAPLDRKKDTALDGVGRALAWAFLGVFVAECLTGLAFYLLRLVAGGPYADLTLPRYVSLGRVMGHFHGLFALAFLFAPPAASSTAPR